MRARSGGRPAWATAPQDGGRPEAATAMLPSVLWGWRCTLRGGVPGGERVRTPQTPPRIHVLHFSVLPFHFAVTSVLLCCIFAQRVINLTKNFKGTAKFKEFYSEHHFRYIDSTINVFCTCFLTSYPFIYLIFMHFKLK